MIEHTNKIESVEKIHFMDVVSYRFCRPDPYSDICLIIHGDREPKYVVGPPIDIDSDDPLLPDTMVHAFKQRDDALNCVADKLDISKEVLLPIIAVS